MPISKLHLYPILLLCFLGCEQDLRDRMSPETEPVKDEILLSLPMNEVTLNRFEAFKSTGENWQLAKDIYTDYQDGSVFEIEDGTGILVNKMNESGNEALYSTFEHGDIELQFEYLLPKGSNSGVYFQGRYELQLFDSYGVERPSSSDAGAIYERWDDSKPEGSKGYDGHAPLINSSKAPGLWQEMRVFFRAPKFDKTGKKTEKASFESVYHNGVLIQDNISLSGPTRGPFLEGEVEYGPLIIQGDHGNIAFKNFKYKSYTQDSLELTDLTYKYFEHPYDVNFPEFDTVKILKEGSALLLDPNIANEKEDHYGLIFQGKLNVPKTGNYLFKTGIDDGGELLLDNKSIIHNEENPGYSEVNALVELDSGMVDFELRYYDNVWNSNISINYEGPNIYHHALGRMEQKRQPNKKGTRILIEKVSEPEIYRNFSMYNGSKRTHALSVGTQDNIHFTYDLEEGALLKFWRGDFADMTDMWKNRGEPQLLTPLNAAVEAIDGVPIGTMNADQSKWEGINKGDVQYKGYEISSDGFPLFQYENGNRSWTDLIKPSADKKMLERTIKMKGDDKFSVKIAQADQLKKLPNGLFSIDGKYYININDSFKTSVLQNKQNELLANPNENGIITYSIFW